MEKTRKTEEDHLTEARDRLLDAALMHVPFDGWSETTWRAARADSGVDPGLARLAFPRGVRDLALACHRRGDEMLRERAAHANLGSLRYSARVAALVRLRLEVIGDRETARAGVSFFMLPQNSGDGTAAIWATADLIWRLLGDRSDDVNWYTKRVILAGVYSATLLYWLGDESAVQADSWAFLDRRIENVMQFEKLKGKMRENPLVRGFMRGPGRVLDRIHAPNSDARINFPGYVGPKNG
ncbi:MAG: COQ9 family protein [Paracoccaceae bacterium]